MSRNLVQVLVAAVVLNSAAVASTMLWPNTARSTASQIVTASADFDHVFASVADLPRRDGTPASLTRADLEWSFPSVAALARPNGAPASLMAPDFDRTFASVSTWRRGDTPPNRERLRNIGWKRILGTS
jgi:hypothetical protein